MSDEAVPATSARLRRPRRPGLAWWMIAVAGPRYARVGGPNVSGPPEDVPWLLVLRNARGLWLGNMAAVALATSTLVATGLAVAKKTGWIYPAMYPFTVGWCLVFHLSAVFYFIQCAGFAATSMPSHLKKLRWGDELALMPIPAGAWALAQIRLFLILAAWSVLATIPAGALVLIVADGERLRFFCIAFAVSALATFVVNWTLFMLWTAGNIVLWIAGFSAFAFYMRSSKQSRGDWFAHYLVQDLRFHAATLLSVAVVGALAAHRSSRHYPEILKSRMAEKWR